MCRESPSPRPSPRKNGERESRRSASSPAHRLINRRPRPGQSSPTPLKTPRFFRLPGDGANLATHYSGITAAGVVVIAFDEMRGSDGEVRPAYSALDAWLAGL